MKTIAIVPIKLNNERLPGKNTKLLGDNPLMYYVLNELTKVDGIDEVYVYCSSDEICKYLPVGVQFLKRPDCLDLPTSNFNQIFDNFMSEKDADIYVYAHATAPFLNAKTIDECVTQVKSGKYDSAFSATKIQDYLWLDGKPMNFDAKNLPRSQDLKPIYRETSGVYVFTKEEYQRNHRRIGILPYIMEIGFKESIDINNPEDFELSKIMLNINI